MKASEFREGNVEVVQLVREAIEDIAVKRYNRTLYRYGPEMLTVIWAGGHITWHVSYPRHYADTMGSAALANAHETCVDVGLDGRVELLIGPNGAWERERNEKGWIVGQAYIATADTVSEILDAAFDALSKDLAKRSLAAVAQQLRDKSIGFSKFNKVADIAKEVLI